MFTYVVFKAIISFSSGDESVKMTGFETSIAAIVAFSLGYFPSLAIEWFSRQAYRALGMRQRRSEQVY